MLPLGPAELDQQQGGNQGNQTILYITKGGGGTETFRPSFSYFGLRYASLSGLPEGFTPTNTTLTSLRVNTRVVRTGHVSFNASVNVLNKLQTAIVYTLQSTIHSHPEDCPQRERHGWSGDAQLSSAGTSLNFDMESFYTNWLRTIADAQRLGRNAAAAAPDDTLPELPWFGVDSSANMRAHYAPTGNVSGAIPDLAPFGGWPGNFPSDPIYATAIVMVPWEAWKRTGRVSLIEAHYQNAQGVLEFLDHNAANASWPLYTQSGSADWLCCTVLPHCGDESGALGKCNVGCLPASTAAYVHVLTTARLLDMARVLNQTTDVKHYQSRLDYLGAAYHQRFFVPALGRYTEEGSSKNIQSHQVFPLYLNLVPPEHESSVVAALVSDLNATGGHVNSGLAGTRFLLETLVRYGHAALALSVATNPSCPGWAYMIEKLPGEPSPHSHGW